MGPKTLLLFFCLLVCAPAVAQPTSIQILDEHTLDMDGVQKNRLDTVKKLPGAVEYKLFVPLEGALLTKQFRLNTAELFGNGGANYILNIQRSDSKANFAKNADVFGKIGLDLSTFNKSAEANFTVREGQITGTVVDQGFAYVVRPLGGGLHAIVKRDLSKLPPDHPAEQPPPASPRGPVDDFNSKNDLGSAKSTVPIVVGYSSAVETTTADPLGLVQNAVEITNQSFENSKIPLKVELRGVVRLELPAQLDVLKGAALLVAKDQSMSLLLDLKSQAKAAFAIVLVSEGWACGKASVILGKPDDAYAAVRQDCAVDKRSFPHELGHLFGARHERLSDPNPLPFPFGHGYQSKSHAWRDIMANDCGEKCDRRLIWSSPDMIIDSEPAGTVEYEDNARLIRQTGPFIANW
ncbi:zinc-dependent metalloprotease family protein [Rhodopseudomonas palustris]|uniref:zinc-dependent metalloprotease family protein n=1 Tax=Rhodopseudomonas palustris TaxID=1076 RepID=UPI000D1BE715|nr:zinc-dependent metalloprotease family protein [Rhodopseudomonas palustris]AVT81428.1 hypothetical protein RPYSC3_25670 [Rhodopseudomonas palustris]